MNVLKGQFLTDVTDTIAASWYGFQHLAEASALVIVSAYTVYGAFHYAPGFWLQRVLVVAATIIGLRGAHEFVKCLAHQGRSARAKAK